MAKDSITAEAGSSLDPEVPEKPRRRRFSAEYKLGVVTEADACTSSGEVGALLRREGLYSSHLSTWRRQRDEGQLHALSPKKRGRRVTGNDPVAAELAQVRREKAAVEQKLKQVELIIGIQKSLRDAGDSAHDGQERRERLLTAARELSPTVGTAAACRALTVSRATYYRRCAGRRRCILVRRRHCTRRIGVAERQTILDLLHSERFIDKAPAEVYATMLDEGKYLCSERTMYRILAEHGEVRERRNQLRHPVYEKPELLATAPNEVWSWDITKLKGPAKWTYFYLYVILDIFSRYVVGWMIAHRESATLAKRLIAETFDKERIEEGRLAIHADRGTSMTSKLVAQLLADLGVTKSHSRPHVSNDNPYSESHFKTLKYRPGFPDRFGSIEDARSFCRSFVGWYLCDRQPPSRGRRSALCSVLARENATRVTRADTRPWFVGFDQPLSVRLRLLAEGGEVRAHGTPLRSTRAWFRPSTASTPESRRAASAAYVLRARTDTVLDCAACAK